MAAFGLVLLVAAASVAGSDAQYSVQLDPWGDDSIRVRVAPPGNTIQDPPIMALLPDPPASSTAVVRSGPLSLANGNLRIDVDSTTSLVTATRLYDGKVLLTQTALAFAAPTSPGTRAGSVSALVSFAGTAGEKVYGLGEHATGTVDQMPYYKLIEQSQCYSDSHGGDVSIPWYASSLGYGFLWNSPAYGWVNLSADGLSWFANATMNADFWITTTSADPSLDPLRSPYSDLLRHYLDAVGHAAPMPFYATGFIQCKDRYRNQSQLMDVARGYVQRGLPISVIVIDWMHWIQQGDWAFNPACWPDPQAMYDELQELGIELMVTFWPFQTQGDTWWSEYVDNNYLVPLLNGTNQPWESDTYLYDPTNPDARAATFRAFMKGYGVYGIKTIWLDAAEPERMDPTSFGKYRLSLGTDAEVGEAWVVEHTRTFAEGFASVGIEPGDYFVLPRHAWVGTWRYSAGLWSGDIQSAFDVLAVQIKVAQGVAMSGIALWTTDIGGYWGGDPSDPQFQDLIVRWFQFGAFCPLFRLHGHRDGGPPADQCGPTNGDNEVWNLAQEPTHFDGIVSVMRLRENLRQYVSNINQETVATGMPMLRPMFLQFPNDPACGGPDVEDQFMFGPSWLVAPVYTYQATSRSVYLPVLDSNHTWIYWFNQTTFGGGQRVTIATPINEFPLFYAQPVDPPTYANADFLYSDDRLDQLLCVSSQCYTDNEPSTGYTDMFTDSVAVVSSSDNTVNVNGSSYALVPLNLFFSYEHDDNYVATNASAPDSTYTVTFNNGYVLAEAAPGTVPLQVWLKAWNATKWDYGTFASAKAIAWAQTNGYKYQWTTGYAFESQSGEERDA